VLYILDSMALSCLCPDEAIQRKYQSRTIPCLSVEENLLCAVLSRVKLAMSISSDGKFENHCLKDLVSSVLGEIRSEGF
jgi:hypothetical protein